MVSVVFFFHPGDSWRAHNEILINHSADESTETYNRAMSKMKMIEMITRIRICVNGMRSPWIRFIFDAE